MMKFPSLALAFTLASANLFALESRSVTLDKSNFLSNSMDLKDISVTADGTLVVSPSSEVIDLKEIAVATSFVPVGSSFLVGTNTGKIYKAAKNAAPTEDFDTKELSVTSMVVVDKVVYAATIADGKIFAKKGDQWSQFVQLPSKYVWNLLSNGGKLYAVCGLPACLYEIDLDGSFTKVAETDKVSNFQAVLFDGNTVWIGSSDRGYLYRTRSSASAELELVYEFADYEVVDIVKWNNNVYVAANKDAAAGSGEGIPAQGREGNATLWAVTERTIKPVVSFNVGISDLETADDRVVISLLNSGRIYSVDKNDRVEMVIDSETSAVSNLLRNDRGILFAGSRRSVLGEISSARAERGSYTSKVLDLSFQSKFGSVAISGSGRVTVQVRTGNVARPDETWSGWSSPVEGQLSTISVNSGRYVQFKIDLIGKDAELEKVVLFYKNMNRPPFIQTFTVTAQALPRGKQFNLSWTADDPDKDTLTYNVYYRLAGSRSWVPLARNLIANNFTVKDDDLPEGEIDFRVVASDSAANGAEDAFTTEKISATTVVDKTGPKLVFILSNGRLTGHAEDALSVIKGLSYKVDGGTWIKFPCADALFDSKREEFDIAIPVGFLSKGSRRITVKVTDMNGQSALVGKVYKIE